MNKCIIERREHGIAIVECYECKNLKTTQFKEHNRLCKKQSERVQEYRCYNCYKKYLNFNRDKTKTEEFKQQCKEITTEIWNNEGYRNKQLESKQKLKNNDEFKNKISKTIKEKFKNDKEYVEKCKIARKLLWNNEEYRNKQKIVTEKNRKTNKGIFDNSKKAYISRLQVILYDILDDLQIEYIIEHKIGYYQFDCYIPSIGLLIECNGDYWHNTKTHIRNDGAKTTYISKYFPDLTIKTLWEHDFLNPTKILDTLMSWLGLNQLEPIEIDLHATHFDTIENKQAVEFIQKYHYTYSIGHGRSQIRFGLFYNDILIAVCCFASVTRHETCKLLNVAPDNIRELVRLCRSPFYHNKNMLSWFLSKCEKKLKETRPQTTKLVTFADTTHGHTGTIYKACNWAYHGKTQKSYWYIDQNNYVMHKKTLYNHARTMGIKETDYAAQNGYRRIWGKEKHRYIKDI